MTGDKDICDTQVFWVGALGRGGFFTQGNPRTAMAICWLLDSWVPRSHWRMSFFTGRSSLVPTMPSHHHLDPGDWDCACPFLCGLYIATTTQVTLTRDINALGAGRWHSCSTSWHLPLEFWAFFLCRPHFCLSIARQGSFLSCFYTFPLVWWLACFSDHDLASPWWWLWLLILVFAAFGCPGYLLPLDQQGTLLALGRCSHLILMWPGLVRGKGTSLIFLVSKKHVHSRICNSSIFS